MKMREKKIRDMKRGGVQNGSLILHPPWPTEAPSTMHLTSGGLCVLVS